jgi:hypothetical protein
LISFALLFVEFIIFVTLHQQQGGFTGIVPSKYNHLDLSCSSLGDEDLLVLSTSMFPTFAKVPGLVRVNRLLQVRLARSRVFECAFTLGHFICAAGRVERRESLHQPHFRLAF